MLTFHYPLQYAYGLLYLLFLAYPVVFVQGHGFNAGESGLTFLPLFLGGVIGVALVRKPPRLYQMPTDTSLL